MPLPMFSIMYFGLQATYRKATYILFNELCHIAHDKMFLLYSSFTLLKLHLILKKKENWF